MSKTSHQSKVTPARLVQRFFLGRRSQSGSAMVEFALLAPAFIAIVGGIFEFSGILFAQTLLEGGVREASRFGIIGSSSDADAGEAAIKKIIKKNAFGLIDADKVQIVTLAYHSFGVVGQPEPFDDANGNGRFDPEEDEEFEDVNGNGAYDDDQGAAGLGGGSQVVLYRLAYDWDIMIPIFEPFFGEQIALEATVAVRNEPFGT